MGIREEWILSEQPGADVPNLKTHLLDVFNIACV
jgi:hypothetical protein